MSQELAARHGAWSDTPRPLALLLQILVVAEADIRKLLHDPMELFTRMLQPVLWLVIFAPVFSRVRAIPTGGLRYLDFMAPGVLAQSVMFGSIFYGISVISERDQGVLQKFLVSPVQRVALVAGRALSSTLRGLVQAVLVYLIAFAMGVALQFDVLAGRRCPVGGNAGRGHFLHILAGGGLHREIARAIHGDRTDVDHASVSR